MKTKIAVLCAILATAFLLLGYSPSAKAQGVIGNIIPGPSLTVIPVIGPATKTPQFINDVSYGLLHGLSSYGTYTALANDSSVNISNQFFWASGGMSVYFALLVTNAGPFTLSQIAFDIYDPFTSFSGTLGEYGISFSNMGQGVGLDGTLYTNGNADTPIYKGAIVGLGSGIDIGYKSVAQALADWADSTPYKTTVTYTLGSTPGSASLNFIDPVPEPATIALVGIGAAIFGLHRKMKAK